MVWGVPKSAISCGFQTGARTERALRTLPPSSIAGFNHHPDPDPIGTTVFHAAVAVHFLLNGRFPSLPSRTLEGGGKSVK